MKIFSARPFLKLLAGAALCIVSSCASPDTGRRAAGAPTTFKSSVQDTSRLTEKARKYFIEGSVLEMQKRHAEAIVEYQEALRHDSSAVILYALAKNYMELSKSSELPKLEQALEYARKAIRRDPDFVPALAIAGDIYASQYDFAQAASTYEEVVRLAPSRQHRFILARLYEYQDLDKAIAIYEELIREEEDYGVLYRLTDIYRQQGRQEDLSRTLLKMMALAPDNPAIGDNIFQHYIVQKNFLKAYDLLQQFEKHLSPDQMNRYYALYGGALISAGDSLAERANLAQTFLLKLEAVAPSDWRVLLTGGFLADAIKNDEKAENFFKKAVKAADTIADVPVQIALQYIQTNRFQKAVEFLKEVEAGFLKEWRIPFFKGIAYGRMNNNSEAISSLLKAASLDSTIADTWIQLGLIYDEKSMHRESDNAYEKALAIDPENSLANNNYAYALSQRGIQLDRALRMIEIAYKADPDNASYLDTYGWILYKLGDYQKALGFIRQAIEKGDVSAAVYEHLGDVYIKLKDSEKAREAWEQSLQKDPGRTSAQERLNTIR